MSSKAHVVFVKTSSRGPDLGLTDMPDRGPCSARRHPESAWASASKKVVASDGSAQNGVFRDPGWMHGKAVGHGYLPVRGGRLIAS